MQNMGKMGNSGMGLSGISPETGTGIRKINRYREITDILMGRSGLSGYSAQNPGNRNKKAMSGLFSLGSISSIKSKPMASAAPKAGHQGMGM